jgi:transcription antitermination factor NusB
VKTRPSMASRKRTARGIVIKAVYQMEMGGLTPEEVRAQVRRKCSRSGDHVQAFACSLADETLRNMRAVDGIIGMVAENWDLSRMAAIDRNILRVGAVEILLFDDIPEKVTINEAIEIAKKFSTESSGRFVNGLLDKIARMKSELRSNL